MSALIRTSVAAVLAFVAAAPLAAQNPTPAPAPASPPAAAPNIVGDWVWTAMVDDQPVSQGTMRLVRNGGVLQGSVVFPEGEAPLESVSFDGRVLLFTVPGPNGAIRAEGRFADGVISGTWSDAAGGQGTWTARRP